MISIDALYFLLLIELMLVFAGAAVFFFVRERRRVSLQPDSMTAPGGAGPEPVKNAATEGEAKVTEGAAGESEASVAVPEKAIKNTESSKIEVTILEEKLKEKIKLLNDLQSKFDELEKEYLILYRQQQSQQKQEDGA